MTKPYHSDSRGRGQPGIQLRAWKRIGKGALIGVASISLPVGSAQLEILDLPVLAAGGSIWASFPAKPFLDKDGRIARIPGTGKTRFVNILHWRDPKHQTRFSRAVVALVRQRDPGAFERGGS